MSHDVIPIRGKIRSIEYIIKFYEISWSNTILMFDLLTDIEKENENEIINPAS